MSERKALNDRMTELVKKRDAFVTEQQKKQPGKTADSFDQRGPVDAEDPNQALITCARRR